jgi:hemolysin activation/secretion protein
MNPMTMPTHFTKLPLLALTVLSQLAFSPSAMAQQTPDAVAVPAEPTLDIRSYVIDGNNPLSDAQTALLLQPYTGEQRKLSQIEQAALTLEKALRERGYIFHRVFVPVQKPQDGKVTLQVIAFRVGQVAVMGNQSFSTANIRRSLPNLQEGSVPDIREVGQDLTAANANPAKQVTVTFKESAQSDAVDADLRVKDSDPLSYFVSYTGNLPATAKNPDDTVARVGFGVQHANLWDRDHVGALTYSTDPSKQDKVSLWGAYYQFPVYGRGLNVSAYYTSSDVNSGLGSLGLPDVSGKGEFLGARVTYSLPRSGPASQTLGLALDDRHFDQGLPGTVVASFPLSLKYTFRRDESWGTVGANVEYAANTSEGSDNNQANYTAQAADWNWEAWRAGLDFSYRGSQWYWAARLRAQASSSRLITGEKMSLGGAGSVRGFSDAVVRGDMGYFWSLEATGPEVLLPLLRPVLFVEGGQVQSNGAVADHEELASVGAGLRWSYQKLDVSADLALATKVNSAEKQTDPMRLHLSAIYRF